MIIFEELSRGCLQWLPEYGIGYYPVGEIVYNEDSFAKHQLLEEYDCRKVLNEERVRLVNQHTKLDVLDIGIGGGAFVLEREQTFGFDHDPAATDWLIQRKLYRHPFRGANSLTFWDSLQSIHDPRLYMSGAKEYLFISTPIYENADQAWFDIVDRSREAKVTQCWFWTYEGLILFMSAFGFEMVEAVNLKESGRSKTFVFKRI